MPPLYQQIAIEIAEHIASGIYRPGERMPGVRTLASKRGVSTATVVAAYRQLEEGGHLQARARSGFYVRPRRSAPAVQPPPRMKATRPRLVDGQDMAMALIQAANNPDIVQLGAAVPAPEFLPVQAVARSLSRAMRLHYNIAAGYMMPPGLPELRRHIARRMNEAGAAVSAEDVVITTGCQEALTLALRAVTQPGDTVAVESPAFYGLLHVLESLGLKALEIPSHPHEGIALEALGFALERWSVKACVVVPNFSNPLGFLMSDARKQALITLLSRHGVPLIEDDVYGDLGFDVHRPSLCKGLAPKADILYCNSFSKTLSPGLRVGWVAAGRHQARVEHLKYVSSIATPTAPQLAVAELLESGRYERHLRDARHRYRAAVVRMTDAVARYFPAGTRITQPQGGFVLWLEFAEDIDTFALAQRALDHGISIAPGSLFSASGKFGHHVRLSCATPWNERLQRALMTLAKLVH